MTTMREVESTCSTGSSSSSPISPLNAVGIDWKPDSWMTDTADILRLRRLREVHMIGSHDAGTYRRMSQHFGPDAPRLLRRTTQLPLPSLSPAPALETSAELPGSSRGGNRSNLDWGLWTTVVRFPQGLAHAVVRSCANYISVPWAQTQNVTVLQQLELGVRYLDIRVAPNHIDGSSRFYTTHTLMFVPLSEIVADIAAFFFVSRAAAEDGTGGVAASHDTSIRHVHPRRQREVVIVDLQHVFGVDPADVDTCKLLFAEFEPLRSLLMPASLFGPHSRMADIWSSPYRILLCVGRDLAYQPPYAHSRRMVMMSPWHNCNSVSGLLSQLQSSLGVDDPLEEADADDDSRGSPRRESLMFVTQAVLSPKVKDILIGVVPGWMSRRPTSILEYASRVNSLALAWWRDVNLAPRRGRGGVDANGATSSSPSSKGPNACNSGGAAVKHGSKTGSSMSSSTCDGGNTLLLHERQQDAATLGLEWDEAMLMDAEENVNTHANVLLLDYFNVGTCGWLSSSDCAVDAVALCVNLNIAAVAAKTRRTTAPLIVANGATAQ